MNKRAAIYARFSSELQRDRSIEDQVALCRDYAARSGYEIVAVFADRAMTGSSLLARSGIQGLLLAARQGKFEFVLSESLSRLARDQEDAPAIRKRLEFSGVKIVTTTDGVVSPLLHGLRTIIDSQYLDDLKGAVRRGMSGVVRDGRHAGGLVFGYRSVPGKKGELEIAPDQAEVVRRIFRDYVAGFVPRAIAAALNAEGVASPRGAFWRASTINGHTKRKTGILQNELYCGRIIWNRAYRIRDPDSGQRIWRHRSEIEWQRSAAPHLRIVEEVLFEEAQRFRVIRARPHLRPHARPKRILSGLLRCGVCGSGMSKKDVDHGRPRIICTRMKEAKACENSRNFYVDEIERVVIGGLRHELGTPAAVAYFIACYNEEKRRASVDSEPRRQKVKAQIAAVEQQIDRAVLAVIQGQITESEAAAHLPSLRDRLRDLSAEQAEIDVAPVVASLRPEALSGYLEDLEHLDRLVNADLAVGDDGAARVIRKMIESVTVIPSDAGSPPGIVVRGDLSSVLAPDLFADGRFIGGAGGAGCPFPPAPPPPLLDFTLRLGSLRAA